MNKGKIFRILNYLIISIVSLYSISMIVFYSIVLIAFDKYNDAVPSKNSAISGVILFALLLFISIVALVILCRRDCYTKKFTKKPKDIQ